MWQLLFAVATGKLGLEIFFYINCRFRRRKVHFCEFCLTEKKVFYCAQNFITNFRTSNCKMV